MALKSSLHQAAREWAEAGYPVFPIHENAKTPATANGWKDSTTDLAKIDAWWTENPNYNIGWSPELSSMAVLDTDPPLGEQTLRELEKTETVLPSTFVVSTPRGGRHYWFTGSVASSVQKLGPKLDTRGRGGYVLIPPSVINGVPYAIVNNAPYAPLPEWVTRRLNMKEQKHVAATDELDLPANLARARTALSSRIATGDVAIEGHGGDARTVQQAYEMRDLGLSEEAAFGLMVGDWNDACQPPWDSDELATKVHNAYQYAQNDAGAYAVAPPQETFAEYLKSQPKPDPEKRGPFYLYDEDEQDAWPEPSWLVPEILPDEATVMLYGPSRSFKSFMALDLALGLAFGKETFGQKREPVPTVFIAGESPRGLSRQRRPAWKLAREAEGKGLFYMVKTMPTMLNGGMADLAAAIRAKTVKPKLIVIDTLAVAMAGMNENDARDASVFLAGIGALRDEFGATVMVVHHTGKDADRGARGSSAFFNGFDTVLEAKANQENKTVAVTVRKMKDADEREEPWRFQGKIVGPGLVFFPIDKTDYDAANKKDDMFAPSNIGAVLDRLGARGVENGVSSYTLATGIMPAELGEDEGERADAISKLSRRLTLMAKTHLGPYAYGDGAKMKWALPS